MAEKPTETMNDIRKLMEQTREDIAGTLEGIRHSFGRRGRRSGEKARGETSRRARMMFGEVDQMGKQIGRTVLDTARGNPVPLALLGLGLSWLAAERFRGLGEGRESQEGLTSAAAYPEARYEIVYPEEVSFHAAQHGYYTREGETMEQVSEKLATGQKKAEEKVGQARDKASRQARKAEGGFRRLLETHPLVFGLGAAAFGAVVGFAIPETRREREVMGQSRDELVERSKEIGRHAVEEAKTTLKEAGEAAKEEIEKGLNQASKEAAGSVREETSSQPQP